MQASQELDQRVDAVLAALSPRLKRLLGSGENWKLVLNGHTSGEVKVEATEFAKIAQPHGQRRSR